MERQKRADTSEGESSSGRTSLKQLAKHLKLSTTTLSLVLNDAPSAVSIPQETKDRIFKAARELNFKPRDPGETLHDTVAYLRENFLGSSAFGK